MIKLYYFCLFGIFYVLPCCIFFHCCKDAEGWEILTHLSHLSDRWLGLKGLKAQQRIIEKKPAGEDITLAS